MKASYSSIHEQLKVPLVVENVSIQNLMISAF